MAESVVTVTNPFVSAGHKDLTVVGTLAVAAGDYTTGGIACDFRSIVSPPLYGITQEPVAVMLSGNAGYQYSYVPTTKKLMVRQDTNPGAAGGANIPFVELAAAATPAAVVSDSIKFIAVFRKNT